MTTPSTLLLDTARRGELHHAIILHGPSLAPLRELATRVAKTLNCLQGSTGDDCLSCQRIDRRIHPDVHHVEVGDEKKMISIEQIRDIVSNAALRPYEGRTKVFLIDPADGLSVAGSNSLLKTLEEPTRDTTFILITRSPDLLLPTINSRCQRLYVGQTTDSPRAQQVALLEDDDLAANLVELLERYASRGESAALLALATIVASHDDVKDALALLGAILCDAVAHPDKLPAIPRERLLAGADASMAAIRNLTVNADTRLLAESIVAALIA